MEWETWIVEINPESTFPALFVSGQNFSRAGDGSSRQSINGSRKLLVQDSSCSTGKPGSGKTAIAARLCQFSRDEAAPFADLPSFQTPNLVKHVDALRQILELIYQQRITFKGEEREPSGPKVITIVEVKQVLGNVVGLDLDLDVIPEGTYETSSPTWLDRGKPDRRTH